MSLDTNNWDAPNRDTGDRDTGDWTVELPTVADTERLGAALAQRLQAGDLVVLSGPLGAGKTVLARGIGAGLGVQGPVTSPTFVIARVHRGPRVPMVHVDAYRLESIDDVDALDLDTDLAEAVVVVEWGEGLVERLAEEHLLIRLERRADEARIATGGWHGGGP
jgi:tRNA threonylcarbamoyladenosine biosynthesis protein TsaE